MLHRTSPSHMFVKYRPFSFDIESTGLSHTDRIIELAIVDVRTYLGLQDTARASGPDAAAQASSSAGHLKVAHWSSLVNPQGLKIGYHAAQCHGGCKKQACTAGCCHDGWEDVSPVPCTVRNHCRCFTMLSHALHLNMALKSVTCCVAGRRSSKCHSPLNMWYRHKDQ